MRSPRPTLVALVAAASGLTLTTSVALAPNAGSVAPQERTAGTSGAKAYHQLAKKKKKLRQARPPRPQRLPRQPRSRPPARAAWIGTTKAGGAAFLANLLKRERKKSRAPSAPPRSRWPPET